jgi:hypothetical protein
MVETTVFQVVIWSSVQIPGESRSPPAEGEIWVASEMMKLLGV